MLGKGYQQAFIVENEIKDAGKEGGIGRRPAQVGRPDACERKEPAEPSGSAAR